MLKLAQETAVWYSVKCFGEIEDQYIYLFALINMFQQVMRSHQQLSLSRVLCPESVVSFSAYVISVDVTMQV